VVYFDALSDRILLQVSDGYGALFFANKVHEILFTLSFNLSLILLFMVGKHPNIHIFALGTFYALHKVVWAKFLEDFVKQVGGKLGAMR